MLLASGIYGHGGNGVEENCLLHFTVFKSRLPRRLCVQEIMVIRVTRNRI